MNLKRSCILWALTLIHFSVFSQSESKMFPQDYLGVYKGNLVIEVPNQAVQEMPMELHILETDTSGRFVYQLVYNGAPRNYNLVTIDAEKGIYEIDENNSIILPCRFKNNTLFSFWQVGDNFLSSRLAFMDDQIDFEILFTNVSGKTKTGEATAYEIYGYPITTMQKAILSRE